MSDAITGTQVAFIGLGAMGYPMAGHLLSQGHATTVYNRTIEKAEQWCAEHGGSLSLTPAGAAVGANIVFLCVGNDSDVRSVVYGDTGVLATMASGAILVDHTTASAELAKELSTACAARGIGFLDAPVSGGQAGAENGVLTVMAGGDRAAYDIAEPVMASFARSCRLMGDAGSGQLTKMVNQICIAGLVQGLSEALNFADKAGLDEREVIDAISKGAAQSWQMENRHETMIDGKFDFGFAVDWMRKDLGIALKAGNEFGASLPITALVDQFYADIQAMGGGRWDTSSLIQRMRKLES